MMKLYYKRLSERAVTPERGTEYSNGLDLYSAEENPVNIFPGKTKLIKTDIAIQLFTTPHSKFFGFITPRSGLAFKQGITIQNSPGLIDTDYTGNIGVILYNTGAINDEEPVTIHPGDRIAQLVILEQPNVVLQETDEIHETLRGDGGFGSTGR